MTPPDLFPLPLVPIETYLLLDDSPAYPMTFLVELKVEGEVLRQPLQCAVTEATARHPLLGACVRWSRGQGHWVPAQEVQPDITWTSDGESLAARPWLNLRKRPGLRIVVRQEHDRASLWLEFHHACCDGEGARRFIADMLTAYARATMSSTEAIGWDTLQPQRLRQRGNFSGRVAVEPTSTVRKLREAWGFHVLKPAPLAPRRANDTTRSSPREVQFLTSTFDRGETQELRRRARETNASLNDVAIALLFHTLAQWNRQYAAAPQRQRLRILVPTDLRDQGDRALPAANRTGFAFLTRRIDQCQSHSVLIAGTNEEMRRVKRARLGLDFIHGVALAQTVPKLLPAVLSFSGCITTAVLTNLGDPSRRLARRFPSENGTPKVGNLRLRTIGGVPPIRSGTRAAFGLCEFGGRLTVSAQCDANFLERSAAKELLHRYEHAWRDWAGLYDSSAPQSDQ